ncbi:hypothetical protein OIO90_003262 [Microbotryomycetes sp. JL221]|nr:hypothetical protein OIO90_003262 [Microbotryomycetes sp. JL221]
MIASRQVPTSMSPPSRGIQLKPALSEAAGTSKSSLMGSAKPPPGLAINYNMATASNYYNGDDRSSSTSLYSAPPKAASSTLTRPAKDENDSRAPAAAIAPPSTSGTRRDRPFQPAYDAENDTNNRTESVFDLYADMGSEDDHRTSRTVSEPVIEEDEEDEEEPKHNASNPWDTRGQNGLYGGGGRGADDSETGWVSHYEMQSPAPPHGHATAGVEEDLRFDDEQQHDGVRTNRLDSADTYRPVEQERRRSSDDTENSSYGPKTPVNATFPVASASAQPYPPSGYLPSSPAKVKSGFTTEPKTPEQRKDNHRRFQLSKPSPSNIKETISPPLSPGFEPDSATQKSSLTSKLLTGKYALHIGGHSHSQNPPLTPPPVHKVDPALLAKAQLNVAETPSPGRRKSFKWTGRSKKTPQISAPILPEGFVESLGMETVPLTPGMKLPVAYSVLNLPQTPPITPTANNQHHQKTPSNSGSNVGSDHQSPTSSIRSTGIKINRKEAPRPQKIPNRPNFIPPRPGVPPKVGSGAGLGQPIELKRQEGGGEVDAFDSRKPLTSSVRKPDMRQQPPPLSSVGGEIDRMSRDSEASYTPSSKSLAAIAQTRKLYLNGVKEERARQNAQDDAQRSSPERPTLSTENTASSIASTPMFSNNPMMTPTAKPNGPTPVSSNQAGGGGFRNPWGAPTSTTNAQYNVDTHNDHDNQDIRDSIATSISSSDHFGTAHTTNVFHPVGSNRKQSSTSGSSKHTVDPRMYRATNTHTGYSATDLAAAVAGDSTTSLSAHQSAHQISHARQDDEEFDAEASRGRDARQSTMSSAAGDYSDRDIDYYHRGSTSSAYSELSNLDAYPDLDNYAPMTGTSSTNNNNNRSSKHGSQTYKRVSKSSRGSIGQDSFSHLRSTQPLNFNKKQPSVPTQSGGVVTASGSVIGDTGFRNPFG